MTHRWLIKFAPFRTSWGEIVVRGSFSLRGVRSSEARKHLAGMDLGDQVLFYHSQQEKAVVGVLEVSRTAYPDPTSSDPQWLTCDFRPLRGLPMPVPLETLRTIPALSDLPLLRRPRLSVMPLSANEFEIIKSLSSP